jgi:hypothetical protein
VNSRDIRAIVDKRADAENYRVCLSVIESLKKSYLSNNGEGPTYSIPGVFQNIKMTYSQLHIALHRLVKIRDYGLNYGYSSEEKSKKQTEYWDGQIAIVENFISEVRKKRQQEADLLTINLLSD